MPRKLDLGKTLGNTGVFASSIKEFEGANIYYSSLKKDNYLKFQGKTLGHKMLLGQCDRGSSFLLAGKENGLWPNTKLLLSASIKA